RLGAVRLELRAPRKGLDRLLCLTLGQQAPAEVIQGEGVERPLRVQLHGAAQQRLRFAVPAAQQQLVPLAVQRERRYSTTPILHRSIPGPPSDTVPGGTRAGAAVDRALPRNT